MLAHCSIKAGFITCGIPLGGRFSSGPLCGPLALQMMSASIWSAQRTLRMITDDEFYASFGINLRSSNIFT